MAASTALAQGRHRHLQSVPDRQNGAGGQIEVVVQDKTARRTRRHRRKDANAAFDSTQGRSRRHPDTRRAHAERAQRGRPACDFAALASVLGRQWRVVESGSTASSSTADSASCERGPPGTRRHRLNPVRRMVTTNMRLSAAFPASPRASTRSGHLRTLCAQWAPSRCGGFARSTARKRSWSAESRSRLRLPHEAREPVSMGSATGPADWGASPTWGDDAARDRESLRLRRARTRMHHDPDLVANSDYRVAQGANTGPPWKLANDAAEDLLRAMDCTRQHIFAAHLSNRIIGRNWRAGARRGDQLRAGMDRNRRAVRGFDGAMWN